MGLLLLFPLSLGPSSTGVNLAQLLGELWAPLNSNGPSDAVFWNPTEIYQWFDEAKNRLARMCGGFVVYDTSLETVSDQGTYTLPADHASTLQVDVAGNVLRPRSVQQLEALDASWPTTIGTPKAFVQNAAGVTGLQIYPAPSTADEVIGIAQHEIPPAIALSNAILSVPVPVREYFRFFALGEARAKESKAQMQETSDWFKQQCAMLEQAIGGYYGTAE